MERSGEYVFAQDVVGAPGPCPVVSGTDLLPVVRLKRNTVANVMGCVAVLQF